MLATTTRPLHLIVALLALLLLPSPAAAQDTEQPADQEIQWGEKINEREGVVGQLRGNGLLKFKIYTQLHSLEASDARVVLHWRDRARGEDMAQRIMERTQYARGEDYALRLDPDGVTVRIGYPCPLRRGDKETTCEELWRWSMRSRAFEFVSRRSSNPTERSIESISALIQSGQIERAKKAIELLTEDRKRRGEAVETDRFFVLFFLEMAKDFKQLVVAKKHAEAVALLKRFLKEPPVVSRKSCPDLNLMTICLKGRAACGCSDPFGQLPKHEALVPFFEVIGDALVREKEYALAIRLLTPLSDAFPKEERLMLSLADSHWHTNDRPKARRYYRGFRAVRLPIKGYIPKRVFDRFQTPPEERAQELQAAPKTDDGSASGDDAPKTTKKQ